MTETFIHGLLAGYGIAIPVGAIAVLIMDAGMRDGLRNGVAAGAGAATADLLYAIVAVAAGGILVPFLGPLTPQLRLLSGVVLIGLALSGFHSLRRSRSAGAAPPSGRGSVGTFTRFLALTLVNPLTVVYFGALVVGGVAEASGPAGFVLFALGAFIASLSWQVLLALAGSTLGSALPPALRTTTGAIGHSMVLAFGVITLMRGAGLA